MALAAQDSGCRQWESDKGRIQTLRARQCASASLTFRIVKQMQQKKHNKETSKCNKKQTQQTNKQMQQKTNTTNKQANTTNKKQINEVCQVNKR